MSLRHTRREVLIGTCTLAAGIALSTPVTGRGPRRNFTSTLSTDAHENPDTDARGQATFQLTEEGLSFRLIVANIEDVIMGHIHLDHVLGPVAVWLHDFETGAPALLEGGVNGVIATGTITDGDVGGPIDTVTALVDEIDGDNAFVNVHTVEFPGGEIGGRIESRN